MGDFSHVMVKGASILALIAFASFGGWLAQRIGGPAHGSRRWTANANAASGGFLLGAGLFHFMPESHHHFEVLYPNHEFPYGFLICALGFATILGIERMLFDPEAHLLEEAGKRSVAPVLAIALGLHGLIAGFAVGAEAATVSLLSVTAALGVHKFAASVTLGSSLVSARVQASRFWTIILGFAVSTPIGIVLGSAFQYVLADRERILIEGSFDALAAGTFLYIAALDVIHDEFFHKRANWTDMVLFVGGLGVMLAVSVVR